MDADEPVTLIQAKEGRTAIARARGMPPPPTGRPLFVSGEIPVPGWAPPITPQPAPDVLTFKVVALGNSTCGKTVFLAALQNVMQNPDGKRKFYLELEDPSQRQRLREIYKQLATSEEWPRGNLHGRVEVYRFKAMVDVPGGRRDHVFNMEYVDYSGELIDKEIPGSPIAQVLQDHIDGASALFCMLDSVKLAGWLHGAESGSNYVNFEILRLLDIVRAAEVPVHVLLTKWDGFDPVQGAAFKEDKARLEFVRTALLQLPAFARLKDRAATTGTCRLIPISSVGRGVAELHDGRMVKQTGAELRPENVDLPMCAAVADFLDVVASHAGARDRFAMKHLRRVPRLLSKALSSPVAERLLRIMTPVGGTKARVLLAVAVEALGALDRSANGSRSDSPVARLVVNMDQLLTDHEREVPASVLGSASAADDG